MPDWAQIISDALDILKFDGAVQDTLAELRRKWSGQIPALLDESLPQQAITSAFRKYKK